MVGQMSNSFEDKINYLADLTEYAGMADIDPLLKAHAKVFEYCVSFRDGVGYMGRYSHIDVELLWDLVCQVLKMDPDKEYLDTDHRVDGGVFVVEYYKRKGKIA